MKKYTLIKQKLKMCLISVLLLSSGCLFVSAQSVAELNEEKCYKLEINQYDYSVLNSYHDFADTHFDMVKCNFKIKYIEK